MEKRKLEVINIDTSQLMHLICMIPEIFKPVLIFESDVEYFDIGFKEFWLKIKKSEDWKSLNDDEYFDYLKSIYSISLTQIELTEEFYIKHFPETLIMKPKNWKGIIYEEGCYKPKLLKMLEYISAQEKNI